MLQNLPFNQTILGYCIISNCWYTWCLLSINNRLYFQVNIAKIDLPAAFFYASCPRVCPHAFLRITARNDSAYALLAGCADIFLDGNFCSKVRLPKTVGFVTQRRKGIYGTRAVIIAVNFHCKRPTVAARREIVNWFIINLNNNFSHDVYDIISQFPASFYGGSITEYNSSFLPLNSLWNTSQAQMKDVCPTEDFEIDVGSDPTIKVAYRPLLRHKESGSKTHVISYTQVFVYF